MDKKVKEQTQTWLEVRKRTISELNRLASELDKHASNCRKANVAGLAASIAAGFITIGLLAAIPFTGGLSAIGAGVAAGVGIGGGSVSLGTTVAKALIQRGIIKDVQSAIDQDRKITESLMESLKAVLKQPDTYVRGAKKIVGAAKLAAEIADIADDGIKVLGVAGRVSKVLGIVGSAISVAILPFDIYDLVKTSIDIHKNTVSEVADKIRKIAKELEVKEEVVSDAYKKSF